MRNGRSLVLLVSVALLSASGCDRDTGSSRLVGTLERDRIEVVSEAPEPIVSIEVREGERVKQGAVLLRQDTAAAVARAAEAQARTDEARHRLDELANGTRVETIAESRARVAAAKAVAQRDEAEFRRVDDLFVKKLVSASDVDRARAARNASVAAQKAAEAELTAFVRGNRIEEIDQARSALAAAEAAQRELTVADARLVVQAPRDGTIDALPWEIGERPPAGAPVVIMLADTKAYARVYVPEARRAAVRPGTGATIHVDGVDAPLPGTVRYVASEASFTPYYALTQRDRSRLSYLAEVEVSGDAAGIPAGIPVEVDLGD